MSENPKGPPNLPSGFEPGDPLTAESLEALRNALAFALKDLVRGGKGINVTQSGGRFLVSAKRGRGRGPRPPALTLRSGTEPQTVSWTPGLVNGLLPDGIDGNTSLTTSWLYFFAEATLSLNASRLVTAAAIKTASAPDGFETDSFQSDGAPPAKAYHLLSRARLTEEGSIQTLDFGGGNVEVAMHTANYSRDNDTLTLTNQLSIFRVNN